MFTKTWSNIEKVNLEETQKVWLSFYCALLTLFDSYQSTIHYLHFSLVVTVLTLLKFICYSISFSFTYSHTLFLNENKLFKTKNWQFIISERQSSWKILNIYQYWSKQRRTFNKRLEYISIKLKFASQTSKNCYNNTIS